MLLLAFAALFLLTPLSPSLLNSTSKLSYVTQGKCLKSLPVDSTKRNSLEALLCGGPINDQNLKKNLSQTSLIHIFVVSGSHLLLLDQLLGILRIPHFVRFLILSFYTVMVGWQAPAVRALTSFLLRQGQKKFHLHLPPDFSTLLAGLTCLFVFPQWWTSLSLQMSWCAGLALSLPSILRRRHNERTPWVAPVLAQFLIYFLMLAPLWGLGSLHPLSVLFNIFLGPMVAYLLLPSAALSLLGTPFLFCFEWLHSHFEVLIQKFSEPIVVTKSMLLLEPKILWLWIFGLHLGAHLLRLSLRQGKD